MIKKKKGRNKTACSFIDITKEHFGCMDMDDKNLSDFCGRTGASCPLSSYFPLLFFFNWVDDCSGNFVRMCVCEREKDLCVWEIERENTFSMEMKKHVLMRVRVPVYFQLISGLSLHMKRKSWCHDEMASQTFAQTWEALPRRSLSRRLSLGDNRGLRSQVLQCQGRPRFDPCDRVVLPWGDNHHHNGGTLSCTLRGGWRQCSSWFTFSSSAFFVVKGERSFIPCQYISDPNQKTTFTWNSLTQRWFDLSLSS